MGSICLCAPYVVGAQQINTHVHRIRKQMNSKRKGCKGEREAALALADAFPGTEARRGQQFAGGPDSPDVHWIDGVHLEVKRSEQLRLWPAMEQAERDAGHDSVPVVLHRPSRRPWVAIVRLDDLPALVRRLGPVVDEPEWEF